VLLVLLVGIYRMSHFLWGGIESPAKRPDDAAALRRYYQYTDALIGRLMAPYGPRDLVLVLSDHGFEASRKLPGGHKSERSRDGVLFARGPGIAPGAGTAGTRVLDITPAILAWLGLPVAADMDGQVPAFLQLRDVATVPTHDTAPIRRLGGDASESEEEMLEELRALGYLE
jgi:arylsulfatase A-like enzyme